MTTPWYGQPNFVAGAAHFLGGVAFCFLGTSLLGWPYWSGLILTLTWALPKEFLIDLYWGEHDSWRSSAIDFASYLGGAASAATLLYLSH